MAANFWDSTQRRYWQFTKDGLATMRQKLEDENTELVQLFPLPQVRHLNIYFNQQINRLGKRLGVRQQAMATAQVYIKRFYTKIEIRRTNVYLVIATAVYLSCKMEECPQHIRLIVSEARSLWPDFVSLDTSKLGECEFFLISEMSSQLIVHQPYRTLTAFQGDLALTQEDTALAWSIINDHYMTDLPLLFPPHTVALTAILLALVLRPSSGMAQPTTTSGIAAATAALTQSQGGRGPAGFSMPGGAPTTPNPADKEKQPEARIGRVQRFGAWLAESNVDITAMVDCTQELISFYECHEQYQDKLTREQLNRFIKARGLDK
ncbi:RNA polymerase II holoenzyme cyclin-like subunit [Verticillium nonalfalfae]|uniref:RNA polymerase II holoenzyme cyclin-like subunit n=2 Tax=Verticillium TaxID=1036719 RepID=C9SFB4_VERA1|nr:cyclin-C [Verticillium alfalfae VaMs.102]XP_028498723.1 RNA polymerase II holoenzyme cyclin-like subunit [Verticillium nonalfalfae]EEY17900.1 cyclin-C [Verticillium alfalfae VaMs.102]RNJ60565.1 RNA polymerase II holoenzyme cyclin-like subunit [Verticillium nonalfalfae]